MSVEEEEMLIKKNELVVITYGEYGEFTILAICEALADFKLDVVKKSYLTLFPEQGEECMFREDEFMRWLLDEGLLSPVCWKE